MEDKKLNFNRPLLSVRRFPSTVANSQTDSRRKNESSHPALLQSPSYKSDLHSGPLRNPGSVPFVWEQSPGKPKDERKMQKPPVVPNLPPGRTLKPKKQDLETKGFRKGLQKRATEKGFRKEFDSSKDSKNVRSHSRDDDDDGGGAEVFRENVKPQLTYGPNFLQFTDHDNEEDSDFDYDEHENMSYKVCGLLPHFCLKGSIGLLNPVPGLSLRTRLPISSANTTRVGSSSVNSQVPRVASYDHKTLVKHQEDQTVLKNESTEATTQKNSQKLQGLEVYDHLQGRWVSNNLTQSSTASVSERKEVHLQMKGLVSFKELLDHENENEKAKEADPQSPIAEKTLYVDTVHKVETTKSNFMENDVGIFGISHIPAKPFKSDLPVVKSKHYKEMIIQTGVRKDPKVDHQQVKVSGSELPAPPPLPKSPSDSWLWRTLPSVSTKTASLRLNPKHSSKSRTNLDQTVQSQYPQGPLISIPED